MENLDTRKRIERGVLRRFVETPEACDSAGGIARLWLLNEDPAVVDQVLNQMGDSGVIERLGKGESAIFYARNSSFIQFVLDRLIQEEQARGHQASA